MKNVEFLDFIMEKLDNLGNFSSGRLFGGYVVKKEGLPIGLIFDSEIFLKGDTVNRSFYLERGSDPFHYFKKGKKIDVSNYKVPAEVLEDDKTFEEWINVACEAAGRIQKNREEL